MKCSCRRLVQAPTDVRSFTWGARGSRLAANNELQQSSEFVHPSELKSISRPELTSCFSFESLGPNFDVIFWFQEEAIFIPISCSSPFNIANGLTTLRYTYQLYDLLVRLKPVTELNKHVFSAEAQWNNSCLPTASPMLHFYSTA
jgi:hypothetical protein